MKYIEQLRAKQTQLWLYLPLPLCFGLLMLLNWFSLRNSKVDTNEIIAQNIEIMGKNLTFVVMILPLAVLLFVLFFWVRWVHKQSLLSLTTARSRVDWSRVWFAFGIWSAVIVAQFLIQYIQQPEDIVFNFQAVPFVVFLVLAVLLLPLQTSFEEYLMRAYMMQGIGLVFRSRLVALITTSLFFGLLHIANPEVGKIGYSIMIYYIGTGLFLGIITLMDEGVELALGFHAANNLIGALLVTSNWTALQTNSLFLDISEGGSSNSLGSFLIHVGIILPVVGLVFARKYKWKAYKAKLTGKVS